MIDFAGSYYLNFAPNIYYGLKRLVLKEFYGNISSIPRKGEIDLVTEADFMSERVLIEIIGNVFPDDWILSEEAGEQGKKSERLWIIGN